tara:strand:+ start:5015 stop:5212 length:198 start_codon:yes stop_codon:yes gene_type:complete
MSEIDKLRDILEKAWYRETQFHISAKAKMAEWEAIRTLENKASEDRKAAQKRLVKLMEEGHEQRR